jgi:hypothetical protein
LWWGYGADYRLLHLSLKGDTIAEIIVEGAAPEPVTDNDIAEWSDNQFVRSFKERGGVIDVSRIPKNKPYFTDIYADDDGNVWVDVPAPDGFSTFDVFDQEGRRLGRVATGVKRDTSIKPRVKNGRLYLAASDDDVPVVFVFAIERS